MEQLRNRNFIGNNTLIFDENDKEIRLWGEISCRGNIVVTVDKSLNKKEAWGGNPTVQTRWYSYNARIQNCGNLVRYDNQHRDYKFRKNHFDEHHLHLFNWCTNEEHERSPYWIGAQNWPTLGGILHNLEEWYWIYRDELPLPEAYAELCVLQ